MASGGGLGAAISRRPAGIKLQLPHSAAAQLPAGAPPHFGRIRASPRQRTLRSCTANGFETRRLRLSSRRFIPRAKGASDSNGRKAAEEKEEGGGGSRTRIDEVGGRASVRDATGGDVSGQPGGAAGRDSGHVKGVLVLERPSVAEPAGAEPRADVAADVAPEESAAAAPVAGDRLGAAGGSAQGPAVVVVEATDGRPPALRLDAAIFRDIWALAIPALGAVLSDPLMSLIDTGCVGQLGTVHLAALGPNVSVFNFVFQVFSFLGAATCNLLASASAPAPTAEGQRRKEREAGRLLSHAFVLAAGLGGAALLCLRAAGPQLLTLMGTTPAFATEALSYLRIRALSAPAVLVMVVGQGACLGRQDSATPLKVYAVCAAVNTLGDYLLTFQAGMGVAGAAWATLAAQCVGAALFLWTFRGRRRGGGAAAMAAPSPPQRQRRPGGGGGGGAQAAEFDLSIGWHGLPTAESLRPYAELAGPMVLRCFLGMTVYTLVARQAAGVGMRQLAAHQVAMQCFWTLSYFVEPLSIAAQSLVARDLHQDLPRAKRTARMLLLFAGGLGLLLAGVLGGLALAGTGLLTSDADVSALVARLAPQSMLCMLCCALTMALDGIAIACGDVAYVAKTQLANLGLVSLALGGAQVAGLGLPAIWWCLVLFFAARLAFHLHHIAAHPSSHILAGCLDWLAPPPRGGAALAPPGLTT